MMGWAMLHNVARQARTKLHARAFIVDDGEQRIAFVISEILSVSMSIRQRVLERLADEAPELGMSDGGLCLMATHTHSGPGRRVVGIALEYAGIKSRNCWARFKVQGAYRDG